MRRRLYDKRAEAEAIKLRETFQAKPWEWATEFSWSWPSDVREIGEGMAVMYRSDKWKKKGNYEDYKHVCEAKRPWKLFAAPGFHIDGVKTYGETRPLRVPEMPDTIATLALFLGLQCRLKQRHGRRIVTPEGDEGIYQIEIRRGKLAAGRTRGGECFLCVYVEDEGPKLFLFGEELDVEKDGIVG
jgi:hypothetical protein